MVRVAVVITNLEDLQGFGGESIQAKYVAEMLENEQDADTKEGCVNYIDTDDVTLARQVVDRFHQEHYVNNSRISLASAFDLVREENKKAAVLAAPHQPYSYDWWHEKGRIDRRVLSHPHHSRVLPYMDGWNSVEDDDRDAYGDVDFINQ